MGGQRFLDFMREVVAAANDDDFLLAPEDMKLAVGDIADVAGAEPAVGRQRRGDRAVVGVQVAEHHRRAADRDFADRAIRQRVVAVVEDPERHALDRRAHREHGFGVGIGAVVRGGRLRVAALDQRATVERVGDHVRRAVNGAVVPRTMHRYRERRFGHPVARLQRRCRETVRRERRGEVAQRRVVHAFAADEDVAARGKIHAFHRGGIETAHAVAQREGRHRRRRRARRRDALQPAERITNEAVRLHHQQRRTVMQVRQQREAPCRDRAAATTRCRRRPQCRNAPTRRCRARSRSRSRG